MNPKSHCEPYVVYGLLMYVLAEAVCKTDACRFRQTIKRSLENISACKQHREEVSSNEEVPSHEFEGVYESTAKMIHGSTKAIQKLHQEIEYSKEAYDAFCEQVVKPLLDKRLEEPLTVPERHRDG
jgi:glyceraldehyde-3-phosphate dehydrogenase/erythrose-4-phosphate dehydrogenase